MVMEQKKYLKWYNKVGYGSGDLAANCVYAILTSFVMIFLTDTVGLDPGIIGILIMCSKFFDGVTDVFFGNLMDKTHTKMGKARPWMLWSFIGNAVLLVAIFAIPSGLGAKSQYAYFFICYTLLNAVFYTANNIAYASLTSLITTNKNERVQMGSIRFMFSLATNVTVASITVASVAKLGGGAAGWRNMAIIYAVIGLIVNTISVMSVRELPPEEIAAAMDEDPEKPRDEKIGFIASLILLVKNKYFLMIAAFYILMYIQTGIMSVGTYWCTYVLGNVNMLGAFSMAQMLPMIVGLAFTPLLVKKLHGMYRLNLFGYIFACIFRVGFIVAGLSLKVPVMLMFSALAGVCCSPVTGDINAIISEASEYTVRTQGKHIEGAMFSCSSLGIKIGSGIGSALCGILLRAGGYVANAAHQAPSAIHMMNFAYLGLPTISMLLIAVIMYFLKVEKANREWDEKQKKNAE